MATEMIHLYRRLSEQRVHGGLQGVTFEQLERHGQRAGAMKPSPCEMSPRPMRTAFRKPQPGA